MRHGQRARATLTIHYPKLGRRQSRLLGEYFVSRDRVYDRILRRDAATAANRGRGKRRLRRSGCSLPRDNQRQINGTSLIFDPCVSRRLRPLLCRSRPAVSQRSTMRCAGRSDKAFEIMRRRSTGAGGHAIRRSSKRGSPGRFPYSGETWNQFRERVSALRLKLSDSPRQANILAFTSATPTGDPGWPGTGH